MPQYSKYKNESEKDFQQRMQTKQDPFAKLDKTQIAEYQKFLQEYGYYDGAIDSIPGPKTKEAYAKYQAHTKIPPQSEGMRGAGLFGKDSTGKPRTPFKDVKNMISDYLKKL